MTVDRFPASVANHYASGGSIARNRRVAVFPATPGL